MKNLVHITAILAISTLLIFSYPFCIVAQNEDIPPLNESTMEKILKILTDEESQLLHEAKLLEAFLISEDTPEIRNRLSAIYFQLGFSSNVLDDKCRYYSKALELNPKHHDAKHNLSVVYMKYYLKSKTKDERTIWLGKILKINPSFYKQILIFLKRRNFKRKHQEESPKQIDPDFRQNIDDMFYVEIDECY